MIMWVTPYLGIKDGAAVVVRHRQRQANTLTLTDMIKL